MAVSVPGRMEYVILGFLAGPWCAAAPSMSKSRMSIGKFHTPLIGHCRVQEQPASWALNAMNLKA